MDNRVSEQAERAAELIAERRNEMRAYRQSMDAIRTLAARIKEEQG